MNIIEDRLALPRAGVPDERGRRALRRLVCDLECPALDSSVLDCVYRRLVDIEHELADGARDSDETRDALLSFSGEAQEHASEALDGLDALMDAVAVKHHPALRVIAESVRQLELLASRCYSLAEEIAS